MAIVVSSASSYYAMLQPSVGRGLLVVCVNMALLSGQMSYQTSVRNSLRLVGDRGDANGLVENRVRIGLENYQSVLSSYCGDE